MSVRLVRDSVSHNTVQCLRQLLEGAERGEIIGLAFAAVLKGRRYMVNSAGEAHRNPTFSRGMLLSLDDELGRMVNAAADADTTI